METSTRKQEAVALAPLVRAVELGPPRTHFLVSGHAQSALTTSGSGGFTYHGLAVTRFAADPTCDVGGVYVYLRDLEDGRVWSAGFQPTAAEPDSYTVEFAPRLATFRRVDAETLLTVEVCLCPDTDVELRRLTVSNLSGRPRTLEFTTYLEWVLQSAAADASHPAFSKLFVETEYHADRRLIVARRRRREASDRTLVGAHWLVDGDALAAETKWETSRVAFIGRGRTLRNPAALDRDQRLTGTVGPVLDPIASLRQHFYLGSDESASITIALAARLDEHDLLAAVRRLTPEDAGMALQRAADSAAPGGVDRAPGLRFDPPHRNSNAASVAFQPLAALQGARRLPEPSDNGAPAEKLVFDNGLGGFSPAGDEYVIRLRPDGGGRLALPPMPWSHVVANPQAGFIATETGGGCTWTVNSRENRLTHWTNDPVSDPAAEAIYLRDRDRGAFWSPTPHPAWSGADCQVRFGFGRVSYEQTSAQLRQRVVQFVPRDDAVKIVRIDLENLERGPRRLDLFFYAHLALGAGAAALAGEVRTWKDAATGAIFAANASRELADRVSFVALPAPDAPPPTVTGDRTEFLGHYGELASPAAVARGERLSDRCGAGLDPCAALQAELTAPGQGTVTSWALIGEADNEAAARQVIDRYSTIAAITSAEQDVRTAWRERLSAVEIETPSPALNVMVNGWLPYQNIACRLWGRSAYYQSGGAFGFRDQLQDASALVFHDPRLTHDQVLRHAAAQFVEGDVLHWWHPPAGRGIRTRFADDLLWLPLLAAEYAEATGDRGIWDEPAPFLRGPRLEAGEVERFMAPEPAGESGSVYDHACRAIERSLPTGVHGLPLMGCGDWNDGMNRIGADGRGESVWMAFFLYHVLERMRAVCHERGDHSRAAAYRNHQRRLRTALDVHGWDGQWFRRAYFGDGTPLGAAANAECQIDALVQAWSVLSGAADPDRAKLAMDAVEQRLVRQDAGLIQLLDPPFDAAPNDPGYIKGYLPGVRENGGQYTHGVLWFIRALAELGRGSRAVELLEMLTPVHHARTPQEVATYQVEPYVVAADVYSQPPHVGRGGWTWYTGSAGWMFRVAVESILGLRIRNGAELLLNPCISTEWRTCRLNYRAPRGGVYAIVIDNPRGRETGVRSAFWDGLPAPIEDGVARIPLLDDGQPHRVQLSL